MGVPACMLGGAMRLCDSDQGRPVLRFKDGCEGGVLESVAGAHPQASPGAGGNASAECAVSWRLEITIYELMQHLSDSPFEAHTVLLDSVSMKLHVLQYPIRPC